MLKLVLIGHCKSRRAGNLYLNGGLVSAEVVIDDGKVTTGGVVDPQNPLHYVLPQTSVSISCSTTHSVGGYP